MVPHQKKTKENTVMLCNQKLIRTEPDFPFSKYVNFRTNRRNITARTRIGKNGHVREHIWKTDTHADTGAVCAHPGTCRQRNREDSTLRKDLIHRMALLTREASNI